MSLTGPYYIEVATYELRGENKERQQTFLLKREGDNWVPAKDEWEAYEFPTREKAFAMKGHWEFAHPDHVVGVLNDYTYGEPVSYFDKYGKGFYRAEDIGIKHEPFVPTEMCLWCGQEIPTIDIAAHEEECNN